MFTNSRIRLFSFFLLLSLNVFAVAKATPQDTCLEQLLASFTSMDRRAILNYTTKDYQLYNDFLRLGKVPKKWKTRENAVLQIQKLKNAIAKIPPVKKQLYRFIDLGGQTKKMPGRFPWYKGVVFDFKKIDPFLKDFDVGQIYRDQGFVSATLNDVPSGKFQFTSVILKIDAHNARSLKGLSNYEQEMEYLLPPDTEFRVKSIKGKFVEHFGSYGAGDYPDEKEWIKFVHHYRDYFPSVTDQEVITRWKKGEYVPNLIIELEEI